MGTERENLCLERSTLFGMNICARTRVAIAVALFFVFIVSVVPGLASASFDVDMQTGARGPQVIALQKILIERGFLSERYATGFFGERTRRAVLALQHSRGIAPATGYFGPRTRKDINLALESATKKVVPISNATTSASVTSAVTTTATSSAAQIPSPVNYSGGSTTAGGGPIPTLIGTILTAYITGYGLPDNTPPSSEISDGVIHTEAGGVGTYSDPITVAVGHSLVGDADILDYSAGTRFYLPYLRRYFIVEDTCGDGDTPQAGPCHIGYQGHPWLDIWVGGFGGAKARVLACEDFVTGIHTVIKDPGPNYAVAPGPIFGDSCSQLFSETAFDK